jgi:succinyl-CoA synthetase beta subunit
MKIHEYQAKELFKNAGVKVPNGKVAFTPEDARKAAEEIGGDLWVVKAQIHAGGRGKGGGIQLCRSLDEVRDRSRQILGMTLVTHQTGPQGKVVEKVLIEEGCRIAKELYVGLVIDRACQKVVLMGCEEGGVEIEEVAKRNPEKIIKAFIDPFLGLLSYQARETAYQLNLQGKAVSKTVRFMMSLYKTMIRYDCSLVEVNPMILTDDQEVIALDAKINLEDNGLFRHKELQQLRDLSEENPIESRAKEYDLSYHKLDGNIGCMVNGAGLAMATMDIIKHYGEEPANFLDVGGAASVERVTNAFKIICADSNVKAILVNIFGGIVRCDVIAQGILDALEEIDSEVPLVVRLQGTRADEGMSLLNKAQLSIITASTMDEAARKVTDAVKSAS